MAKKQKTLQKIDPTAFSHADVKQALIKNYFNGKVEGREKQALNFLLEIALFNLTKLNNNNI
jgi:hypothetical protein